MLVPVLPVQARRPASASTSSGRQQSSGAASVSRLLLRPGFQFQSYCSIVSQNQSPDSGTTSRLFHAQMLNMCNKVIALFLLSLNRDSLFVAPQRYDPGEKPVFDDHLPSNVTVQQGDTAYLHCRIFNAENMYVSMYLTNVFVASSF